MKKLIFLSVFLLVSMTVFAQKIKIMESTETVDKMTRTGLYVVIELDKKMVEKGWEKRLKDFGKVESSKGVYTVNGANISGVTSKPSVIYSTTMTSGKGVKVWWAIDLGSSFVTSSNNNSAYKGAEKILHDFAVEMYTEDINNQIKDAEKALSNSVKDQEKEVKEGESLVKSVDKNKQEKIDLQQKIKDNEAELVQLQKDIEQNKKDQVTAAQEVEKMKKALEVVKQKLNQIE